MVHYPLLVLVLVLATALEAYSAEPPPRGVVTDDDHLVPVQQLNRRVAFLIGVGAFQNDLQDLGSSPKKDATALAEVLKQGGFEVVALTDEKATRAEIARQFAATLDGGGDTAKPLKKGDLLIVIACTHGFTLPPELGKPDAPFLAAYDSRLDKPETMIGLNGLMDTTRSTGATALYLLDACRALPAEKGSGQARGIEPTQSVLPVGTAVLFGCGRGEVSYQSSDRSVARGHGLLTYSVLKALRGETGLSGELSWSELVAAVQKAFRSDEFRALIPPRRAQTPTTAGGELAYTNILRVVGPVEDDYRAFLAAGPPSPKPDSKRAEFLQAAVKTKLATWKERAEKGDVTAQLLYGHCFGYGAGVEKDWAASARWIQKAAEGGSPDAMMDLGVRNVRGVGGVSKDLAKGAEWTRKAADAGNLVACWRLGGMYQNGSGVKQSDEEAVKWYRQAALAGNADGMFRLAKMFDDGKGVRSAPDKPVGKMPRAAFHWYLKAAEAGHAEAMCCVGWLHLLGKGIKQDDIEAVWWCRKSAEAGHANAWGQLGWLYENGRGVPKNLDRAAECYRKLVASGDASGNEYLKRIGRK